MTQKAGNGAHYDRFLELYGGCVVQAQEKQRGSALFSAVGDYYCARIVGAGTCHL